MPIKTIQVGQAGVSNRSPSWVYIETNDTIAAVTTAGYLSGVAREFVDSFQPNMMALVSTKTSQAIGVQPVLYLLQLTVSNGVWSLVSPAVDVPVPFIVLGDIQAGAPGIAGKFISFPSATGKGSFDFTAVANTGDTVTTVSNAAMGQASVISIPDPGATAANFILSKSAGTQHITSGALEVDAGILSSGLATGGFIGNLTLYPTTSTKGSFSLTATANTGNTATSITNAAMGQASAFTIPDPGTATANIAAAPAALVNNNLVKASGTAGLIADAGITAASVSGAITQLGQLYQVSVTFNTAQMVTAYDTPLTIVANPLSSQMILVLQASVYTASTGHTAYATGTAPIIQYGNTAHGAGTIATAAGLVAGDITAASSQVRNLFGIATGAQTGLSGLGLFFSNATGDYTAGTGTNVTITVVYQLLTATV